jgi:hypothetical protein
MRKHIGSLILIGILGVAAPGCIYLTASPTVKGRAFVVRNEVAGSSFWNCDATSGEPTCYQTKKVPLVAASGSKGGAQ